MNSRMRIVARAVEKEASAKMVQAGADQVVTPNFIGGMRIASGILRPQVVEFLDMMFRDQEQPTRIEQITLPVGSPLAGKRLAESKIHRAADLLVMAIRRADGSYLFGPGPDTVLLEGGTLIVPGPVQSVHRMRGSVKAGPVLAEEAGDHPG
jgi:voltage-gated potassium channel